MKKTQIILSVFWILNLLSSCGVTSEKKEISIKWVDNLTGDFSFNACWSYPEGIYKNEFGQLICDGICPPQIYDMMDKNGKIYKDSLKAFYKLIDTTHLFHSIKSDAWTYEWDGTYYITAERINEDTVLCSTQCNAATHSSLNLIISKNYVTPTIVLIGINADFGTETYNCKSGKMIIDKNLWNEGILKAEFDFEFYNNESSDKMYWKGNIYVKIETNQTAQ
ncbi:MAG: hypothetical protein FWF72_02525 [Paludibacter sp.]|nr:hypothetical protein [Paludibacter sp.]